MTAPDLTQLTSRAAELLGGARRPVALTGAGISTPSGIPDFRSSDTGLWNRVDPMEVASLMAFRLHPRRFYKWFHELAATLLAAEPNSAHLALAELELAGAMIGIVTQNIDGLHQRAGSVRVAEIHGHIRQATCMGCFHHQSTEGLLHAFVETGDPPRCEQCGGYLKPDVILFGEQLPFEQVAAARQLFSDVDFVLVGGSSLEVSPVSNLPFSALNAGARLVIVNLQPTYLDQRADVLIRADVAEVIPVLASKVLHAH